MVEFLSMVGNYDTRKVARNEYPWGTISTCSVTDCEEPYETAVSHKEYDKGDWTVVAKYSTKKAAIAGHAKWIKTMTAKKLPAKLIDCNNAEVSKLGVAFGCNFDAKRKKLN